MNTRTVTMALAFCMSACAPMPPRPPPAPRVPPPPPVSTQVYFYPTQGQSPERQSRDRYECYLWARKQSGFDPSQPSLAPHQRIVVEPGPPPGHDTAVGAVAGAAIGAAVSEPHEAGQGAVVGAIAGAVVGAASDASRAQKTEAVQRRYDEREATRIARLESQASEYRRAMSACLEGRGYTVK